MHSSTIKNLCLSAMFLALGLVMPFLTAQVPQIGNMLLPMHIPVLVCGFVCGWPWGLVVGAITPLLRSALFAMPPLMSAIAMAFELAAYGFACGLLYRKFPQKPGYIYLSLILAMLFGRVIWGFASIVIYGMQDMSFSWKLFLSGGFAQALPGIAVQLVLIPVVVLALEKAHFIDRHA